MTRRERRVANDLENGDHRLVIGEVLEAYAKAEALEEGGLRALDQAPPLLHIGDNLLTSTRDETVEPRLPA